MRVMMSEILDMSIQPMQLLGLAFVAGATVLALTAAASLVMRDRARLGPTNRRICRALRVRRGDRILLSRVAPRRLPAAVLISRGCFDAAVGRYDPGPDEARRLAALRRRVFE